MLFTRKVQYAVKALVTLAAQDAYPEKGEALLVEELAKASRVPKPFLGKIVSELSAVGILNSKRGRGGGISLTRDPKKILLGECIEALDRIGGQRRCVLEPRPCNEKQACPLHKTTQAIRKKVFEETTLAQLLGDGKWIT